MSATSTVETAIVLSDSTVVVPHRRKAVKYGDRIIEAPYTPGCITCRSPHRADIETLRSFGHTAVQIMQCIPETAAIRREQDGTEADSDRFARRIRDHHNKRHSPIDMAVAIGVLEQYAKDLESSDISDQVGTLVSAKGYLTNLLHEAHKAVVMGAAVTARDGIAAAIALSRIEQGEKAEEVGTLFWLGWGERLWFLANDMFQPEDRRFFATLCENDPVVSEGLRIITAKRQELAVAGVGSEDRPNPGDPI